MFDNTGHDINCAHSNDPREACDCGGAKPKPEYKPIDFGHDNSALGGMAGALPSLMDQKVTTLQQQVAFNAESAIRQVALKHFGEGWEPLRAKFTATIGNDRVMTYAHEGKPFLKLYPVEFESVQEENSFKIVATQKFEHITAQP